MPHGRDDFGLEVTAAVLVWFLLAGDVFKAPALNKVVPSVISVIVVFLFIDLGVKLYRGLGAIPPVDGHRPLAGNNVLRR